MTHLPVIVGFGGISPAGRSSFHHGYRRLVFDKLPQEQQQQVIAGLATLTGLASESNGSYLTQDGQQLSLAELQQSIGQQLLDSTLIRKIEASNFDVERVTFNKPAKLTPDEQALSFTLSKRQLPNVIPEHWTLEEIEGGCRVTVEGSLEAILPDTRACGVKAAGQLPSGFEPGKLYQSRNHPRNLQMTVYAASDALRSSGIDFETILEQVSPDDVAVYASNSIGQLDDLGFGGLTKYPSIGKRTTSKQMPLGYAQMPADFVNAYVLGNVGSTGGALGACATFLYNLRSAVQDIRSGRKQVALVGGSDAPVTPEIIEGFRVMGALAEDKDLLALDGLSQLDEADYRRACRPFGDNCGFTIAESSQFTLLMSDSLALELGATIHGAIPDVFVNADGHKKSISAPGIGNYVTLAKSASLIKNVLGDEALSQRSFVQAHGTSTPQNRVTESHVINEVAKAFEIPSWPVSAVKCYLGHSQGTAGGDQLAMSLGVWQHGIIPGITTTKAVAEDVHQSNLHFPLEHLEVGSDAMDAIVLNSKGFGGNNASAPVFAPHATMALLEARHGSDALDSWRERNQQVQAAAAQYDEQMTAGKCSPIYRFGYQVLEGDDLTISSSEIRLPGYANSINIEQPNPFVD